VKIGGTIYFEECPSIDFQKQSSVIGPTEAETQGNQKRMTVRCCNKLLA
jgi:hypothetical protein